MISRKKLLKKARLYLITNEDLKSAEKSLKAGISIVQLRIKTQSDKFFLKKAFEIRKITKKLNSLLIINDRIDIALLVDADGIHLGQDDIPVRQARKLLPRDKLIGKSTHNYEQAKHAIKEGVDYIGIGPVFTTKTKDIYKPLNIKTVKKIITSCNIPYFVIGGINLKNIRYLLSKDIKKIAVFSSIIKTDNPYLTTKRFLKELNA